MLGAWLWRCDSQVFERNESSTLDSIVVDICTISRMRATKHSDSVVSANIARRLPCLVQSRVQQMREAARYVHC